MTTVIQPRISTGNLALLTNIHFVTSQLVDVVDTGSYLGSIIRAMGMKVGKVYEEKMKFENDPASYALHSHSHRGLEVLG